MPKILNKGHNGKVNAENLKGKPVPRKGGLKNQTTGKGAGSANVRRTGGSLFPRKVK